MKSFSVIKKCIISLLTLLAIILVAIGVTNFALPNSATVHTLADSPTAKAVCSTSGQDTTLTFYYDGIAHSGDGTVYGFSERTFEDCTSYEAVPYNDVKKSVTKVVFDKSFYDFKLTSTRCMFAWFTSLTEIENLTYLNTESVTDMQEMFKECNVLKTLDLSNFNTASVTNMKYMFISCFDLTTIYVSDSFVTTNVTTSDNMFSGCENLVGEKGTTYNSDYKDKIRARIDGGEGNEGYFTLKSSTAKAVYNDNDKTLTFFYDNVTYLGEGIIVHDLTESTFKNDVPYISVKVNVTKVVFDESFADFKLTSTKYMFAYFPKLTEIEGLTNFDTESVTDMQEMFKECNVLKTLDLSNFNTASVTNMKFMFISCYDLTTIYVSDSFVTTNVTTSDNMFSGCENLEGEKGTTYNSDYKDKTRAKIDGGVGDEGYFTGPDPFAKAVLTENNTKLTFYFNGIPLSYYEKAYLLPTNATKATDWGYSDYYDTIETVVINKSMSSPKLELYSTAYMFYNFSSLNEIEGLENLNIGSVTNFSGMFSGCDNLSGSIVFADHFGGEELNMSDMFAGCSSIDTVFLHNFDLSQVTNTESMFESCESLTAIYVCEESRIEEYGFGSIDNSQNMFMGCENLVGGNGTCYDLDYVDGYYAEADGYEQKIGYLSMIVDILDILPSDISLQENSFEYIIDSISPVIVGLDGVDQSLFEISGDTSATEVGNYSITVSLKDGVFFKDMTRNDLSLSWTIFVNNPIGVYIEYANVAYEDTLYLFFAVKTNYLNGTPTVKVWTVGDGEYLDTDSDYVTLTCEDTHYLIGSDYYFVYHFDKLKIKQMTDDVFVQASLGEYSSSVLKYSVLQYAYNMLHGNSDALTKEVAQTMLDFGSAVQKMKNYNLDRLANADYYTVTVSSEIDGFGFIDGSTHALVCSGETVYFNNEDDFVLLSNGDKKVILSESVNSYTFTEITEDVTISAIKLSPINVTVKVDNIDFGTIKVRDTEYSEYSFGLFHGATVKVNGNSLNFYYGNSETPISDSILFVGKTDLINVKWDIPNLSTDTATISDDGSGKFIITAKVLTETAKAVYNSADTTLTFYYDKLDHSGEGITVYPLTETTFARLGFFSNVPYYDVVASVTKVVFDESFKGFKLTSTKNMFFMFNNLTEIKDLHYLNTESVTDMYAMFGGCQKLETLDLSTFNTANVTDMAIMFGVCSNLTKITVSDLFVLENVVNSDNMFWGCLKLVGGNGTKFAGSKTDREYARIDKDGQKGYFTLKITAKAVYSDTDKTLTFYYDEIDHSGEGITVYGLTETMFVGLKFFSDVPYSGVREIVTKVVFGESFKGFKLTSTKYMFVGFTNLTEIKDLSYLDTESVNDMNSMFSGCQKLETLDLSNFNTASVTDMYGMFSSCQNLQTLDLSSFNTASVTDMDNMFNGCRSLAKITVSDLFVLENVDYSNDMFRGCLKLVGGNGTTWDSGKIDGTYARIDEDGQPGYFTEKE